MMEVENRIETFGGHVDELADDLRDRRQSGGSGGGGNGVILEESEEDSRDGYENGMEKLPSDGSNLANGRVIKKVFIVLIMDCHVTPKAYRYHQKIFD